ncbi:MAG: ThiF family adenylyltransferase [DPANN group archaeon]|nr:ThiF family adenylyltransferase [DPANN group archaeon]
MQDTNKDLERYTRQMILKGFFKKDQLKLQGSKVVIIGLGALGSVASELILRAGVKNLVLVDRDFVERSNLQRQLLYAEKHVGMPKPNAAKEVLNQIDTSANISIFVTDINSSNIESIVNKCDLILDCTDNMETRFLINDVSLKHNIPWIYAAAVGFQGTTFNIIPGKTACLRCVFSKVPQGLDTCDTAGILSTVSVSISALQVTEALKILTQKQFSKDMIYYDVWNQTFEHSKLLKNKSCPACNNIYEYLDKKEHSKTITLCGRGAYQIIPKDAIKLNIELLADKLSRLGSVKSFKPHLIHFKLEDKALSIFSDGRAIIKGAKSISDARSLYSRFVGN